MAVLYTIGAGLLTFDNGPATYVGNHYFSAWAGFFISFAVFGNVLKEFLGVGGAAAASDAAEAENGGEFLVISYLNCKSFVITFPVHFIDINLLFVYRRGRSGNGRHIIKL